MRVGFTTSIPIEVLFAAGITPVDLNNVFAAAENNGALVEQAERAGFPANTCAWVKGLYATVKREKIMTVISVTAGDCSPNVALAEILQADGIEIIPFAYPDNPDYFAFDREIARLEKHFGVSRNQTERAKKQCDEIRALIKKMDDAAWQKLTVNSEDLLAAQLAASDFFGDLAMAEKRIFALAANETAAAAKIPLALIGVPPILGDLPAMIERLGGRVVYYEIPQQFSRADFVGADMSESWRHFTYPANAERRLAEVFAQVRKRGARGIIHYAQAFCHRQIHDILLRRGAPVPALTIEGDRPAMVDSRTRTRLEAFIEQLTG